jgi:hypothetical protein
MPAIGDEIRSSHKSRWFGGVAKMQKTRARRVLDIGLEREDRTGGLRPDEFTEGSRPCEPSHSQGTREEKKNPARSVPIKPSALQV